MQTRLTDKEAKRLHAWLRERVFSMVRNNPETEDVVQDVWVALLAKNTLERAKNARKPSAYLATSVRNAVKEYFRFHSTQGRRAETVSIDALVASRRDHALYGSRNPEAVAIAELYQ